MVRADRLIELLSVADAGSIAAAAKKEGLTRSTLSRRLSALEEDVGAKLLQRSPRSVRLTLAGEILVERARRIVEEAEDAWHAVRGLADEPSGPIRVSTPPTQLFQDLFVGFAVAYPEARVLISATHRHVDLHDEDVDVALRFGHVTNEDLIVRRVVSARCSLVASSEYLSAHWRPADPRALTHHRCVLTHGQSGSPSGSWPLRAGGVVHVEPHFAGEGLAMALHAAVRGVGIALLPDELTAEHRARGALELVLADSVGMELPGSLVYTERRLLLPVVRAFIDYTVAFFDREARPVGSWDAPASGGHGAP